MISRLHKNGKLLLSGEYAVLDGATALAIPTHYGQKFIFGQNKTPGQLIWRALDHNNALWFEAEYELDTLNIRRAQEQELARALQKVLRAARSLNPNFLDAAQGFTAESQLDFPRSWGLGSSSTLIAAIAQWSNTDAFQLSQMSFGGSGYDIAAADSTGPFTYSIRKNTPEVVPTKLNWPFKNKLYFIHRNQKQNSRQSIAHYRSHETSTDFINEISAITQDMIKATSAEEFSTLMTVHETLIAKTLKMKPVKEVLFSDFPGAIKSLGGWGGDFIMALDLELGPQNINEYFTQKGFPTVLSFDQMILHP
jgi:mevalonate kinase